MKTHYDILGLRPGADSAAIRLAYRAALKAHHPDLHGGDTAAEMQSKRIIAAYDVLIDPERRALYDASLHHGKGQIRRRPGFFVATLLVTMGTVASSTLLLLNVLLKNEKDTRPAVASGTQAESSELAKADAGFNRPQPGDVPPSRDGAHSAPERQAPETAALQDKADHAAARAAGGTSVTAALPVEGEAERHTAHPQIPENLAAAPAPQMLRDAGGEAAGADASDVFAGAEPQHGLAGSDQYHEDPDLLADIDDNVRLGPRDSDAHLRQVAAWIENADFNRALADYDSAVNIDATNIDAFHRRGAFWWRHGDLDRALRDFDQAIRLSFSNASIYFDRGRIWVEKARYERAIADFNRAIKLVPDFARAYLHRGIALRRKGDIASALADFDEAVRLDPALTEAYQHRDLIRLEKASTETEPPIE